ncbi:trimeric intracellular cation channel family protein, partial [Streptococcus agalactiae]|nr:trimeric intracellular cation channel family protein [Streptococcus agalactiae]
VVTSLRMLGYKKQWHLPVVRPRKK